MGNPRPTKSKPCKIGRKHTGAKSEKQKQRQRRAADIHQKQRDAQMKRHKLAIAAFWRGEISSFPVLRGGHDDAVC